MSHPRTVAYSHCCERLRTRTFTSAVRHRQKRTTKFRPWPSDGVDGPHVEVDLIRMIKLRWMKRAGQMVRLVERGPRWGQLK